MPYIPKSRIQTNLYTAGKEYVIEKTLEPYIGFYYKTYDGKIYTGKNPNNKPNNLLVPPPQSPQFTQTQVYIKEGAENKTYKQIKKIKGSNSKNAPQLYYTIPTEDNYKLGEFQRFFCKKRNEFSYLEISKNDHDKLVQQSTTIYYHGWKPFNIPWTLTGEKNKVYNINRNIVLLEEKNKKLYGFSNYLQKEYLKYYKS